MFCVLFLFLLASSQSSVTLPLPLFLLGNPLGPRASSGLGTRGLFTITITIFMGLWGMGMRAVAGVGGVEEGARASG